MPARQEGAWGGQGRADRPPAAGWGQPAESTPLPTPSSQHTGDGVPVSEVTPRPHAGSPRPQSDPGACTSRIILSKAVANLPTTDKPRGLKHEPRRVSLPTDGGKITSFPSPAFLRCKAELLQDAPNVMTPRAQGLGVPTRHGRGARGRSSPTTRGTPELRDSKESVAATQTEKGRVSDTDRGTLGSRRMVSGRTRGWGRLVRGAPPGP